jgi:Outer membrane protein beta-barrel domain
MQDIDDNMDDLLRRASANYPLRINESDWDAIGQRLSSAAETPAAGRRGPKYLRGLFVFFFLFTGDTFVSRQPQDAKLASTSAEKPAIEKFTHVKPLTSTAMRTTTPYLPVERRLPGDAENVSVNKQASTGQLRSLDYPVAAQTSGIEINRSVTIVTKPPLSIDPATLQPQPQHTKKRGRLYAGIVGGPEGNQVNGQVLTTCGFDAGLILGYEFNDRLSLETGLLFNEKHYYCDGQDFNMDMPGMKLESLEGKSTLLEIPVKLKYNIVRKRKWNVFSTAGISSYILANEKNNYALVVNGTRQNMISNYENVSRYLAAAIDLSLGYELKASQRLRLRLQPYLQIPLKGIGVGSIPVQSMGLHVGVTHSFGK